MKQNKWTNEQSDAIYAKRSNLLVAAAAGAGKTSVLVERIINKIVDKDSPTDIDRMLIVTFTNAAAAEMRERIGDSLEKLPNMSRQIALLPRASIMTIHSFCLDVIRNNFHIIDLDPNFRIADDTEITLLKLDMIDELLDSKFDEENIDEDFFDIVQSYGGSKNDNKLSELILAIYDFIQSSPYPKKWLYEMSEKFNIDEDFDFDGSIWAKTLKSAIKLELLGVLELSKKAQSIVMNTSGLSHYQASFDDDVLMINSLLSCCDDSWSKMYNAFSNITYTKLSAKKSEASEDIKNYVKDIRSIVKKRIDSIKNNIFWADSTTQIQNLKSLYRPVSSLSRLVLEFFKLFDAKKREKGILDFSDIEHMCLRILTENEDIAKHYRDKFYDVFVDEYQDSNMVQEVILKTISRESKGEPNIFMVGDVKQSIYRFRQAKPELFIEKYTSYSEDKDADYRKIKLYDNFRSRKSIVDATNFIFNRLMSKELGELLYDEDEALIFGADYKDSEGMNAAGPVELHIVDYNSSENHNEENDEANDTSLDSVQCEARLVASKIAKLLDKKDPYMVYDRKVEGYREARYSDIVILFRATKSYANIFCEELLQFGIPVYADTGSGYFKTVEIQIIMSLLSIIDNPIQDIPLLSVLRSSIGGFSAEELSDIRLVDRTSSMYDALLAITKLEGETANKARDFILKLDKWRDYATYMRTDELLWRLYDETGYYSYVAAMNGGLQRQSNLRVLFERARQFEDTSYRGLFSFINFIAKIERSSGDMGSAKILSENENVVRIMSIHKSKGLEFPIVFLSGCGKNFNLMDLRGQMLTHQELGFGPDYVDNEKRIRFPSIAKEAIAKKLMIETLSEEMRILYVAFTRAKEKLIITGASRDFDKSKAKWELISKKSDKKLSNIELLMSKCYLDWIYQAISDSKAMDEWEVFIHQKSDLEGLDNRIENKNESILDFIKSKLDQFEKSSFYDEVQKRLNFKYPYKKVSALPVKLSVTEFSKRQNEHLEEYSASLFIPDIKKPSFLEEQKTDSSEYGTLIHLVLQHIDIKNINTKKDIENALFDMVLKEFITQKQKDEVNVSSIHKFLSSELGLRLKGAKKLYREVPFNIDLKCYEVYTELDSNLFGNETIMLQGIIDCFFIEEDKIVLIDYKTGRKSDNHKIQLDYYAFAIERIMKMKVVEKYAVMIGNDFECIRY